ncbi:RRM domain-containing protein [Aphelenchoides bicaudatus]|nr:RRM domain-containing protein [Aphelenchoides bicaudatus]
MGDMEIGSLSLDEYIKEKKISGRQSGGRQGGRQRRDGGIQKPKRSWDQDKVSQGRRNSGGGNRLSAGGSGKAIARLSNVPFNITQQDLTDLFENHRLTKITLHYDFRGRSLGTAELHGPSGVISRLAREFKDVEIDGRPLSIQVVGEGGSSLRSGAGRLNTRRVSGGRQSGGRKIGGRRNAGGDRKSDGRKKLTPEELDKELEAYMQQGKSE